MSTGSCPVESASPAVQQWVFRKFSFLLISSSWSTWNFHDVRWRTEVFHFLVILVHLEITRSSICGSYAHMCKMVTLGVGKSVCPCVMWGVIRRDTGNIHIIGVFNRLWGHYLFRNTQVIQVPMLWPSVLRDVVFLQVPGVGISCFVQESARLSSTTSVSWPWS